MDDQTLKADALYYHEHPTPGKLAITISKPFTTQDELCLAYSPGVAEPVKAIFDNPEDAYRYTAKGNLVAVISEGSAVLGLGNQGALASKPVMEGKAVLFKKFADIDVFDIEVASQDIARFIDTVENISPTFGGINLEDIAAPQCFEIEQALVEKLDIPVFHDDQHGTAIIVAAGLINALEIQNKQLATSKIVCLGAGAAAIASMNLLVAMGANKHNLFLLDRNGVIHTERDNLHKPENKYKALYANPSSARTLSEAMVGADVFIGLSGANLVTADQINSMNPKPVVFALSNPDPEIRPEVVKATRADAIIATGRSDYPNQVNNVLGFPYIFRGALDIRARRINQAMHIAAVNALCALAKLPVPRSVLDAYRLNDLSFGAEYILPKPLDPRLLQVIPRAVAEAAIQTGMAKLPYLPNKYPYI